MLTKRYLDVVPTTLFVRGSSWSQIPDPDAIGAVRDRYLGIAVAEIAVKMADLVLPANAVPHAPLRHNPREGCSRRAGSSLAGFAGLARW
jgi:hypothetical protein